MFVTKHTNNTIMENVAIMENTTSKSRRWISYIMSGLVILFMLLDSMMKFIKPQSGKITRKNIITNSSIKLFFSIPLVQNSLKVNYSKKNVVLF